MLAGYLPFDDDPTNPEGDNIIQLYKYIISTPLAFPEYISQDARDLLRRMLVPNPEHRLNMDGIKSHRWVAPYSHIFQQTFAEDSASEVSSAQTSSLSLARSGYSGAFSPPSFPGMPVQQIPSIVAMPGPPSSVMLQNAPDISSLLPQPGDAADKKFHKCTLDTFSAR